MAQERTNQKLLFEKKCISYAQTGYFNDLILDYLNDEQKIKQFYISRPKLISFKAQIEKKSQSYEHRKELVSALQRQYDQSKIPAHNVSTLAAENTFTVTTGHQVCLFTGPMYFVFKIISTINACQRLKEHYPDFSFVPVFWMATEDHDFEEANHFYLSSKKIEWESGQVGALGRMTMEGMDEVYREIQTHLGIGYNAAAMLKLFREAYLQNANIADATRNLVHTLFGKYGVVIIDGDDARLKALMADDFYRELNENVSFQAISQTNKALAQNYKLQVHPREINLFYLESNLRERILKKHDGSYEVLNSNLTFSDAQIKNLLKSKPENVSPNVVLRPLYQEKILPNLAYIGGGGELSYWFQLKGMFEKFQTPFPILMLRNSAMILTRESRNLLKELSLKEQQIFEDPGLIENALIQKNAAQVLQLDDERQELEAIFKQTEGKMTAIDFKLRKSARSAQTRVDNLWATMEKKMIRAEKKKQDVLMKKLEKLREALLPRNGLQERNLNFAPFFMLWGEEFFEALLEHLNPFDPHFSLLTEIDASTPLDL